MLSPTRIPTGLAYPITVTFYSPGSESPVDCDATTHVTVAVTHVNGTVIVPAGTQCTAGAPGSGQYTFTIPPQGDPADMNITLTGTFSTFQRTENYIISAVGGFMADLAEIRALDGLADTTAYPTSLLIGQREAAEELFEKATGRHWTPKYAREVLDGDPTYRRAFQPIDQIYILHLQRRLLLANTYPSKLISITIDDGSGSGPLPQDVTRFKFYESGEIERLLTDPGWPRGVQNVVIEYVHGVTRPPADLRDAFTVYLRHKVLNSNGRISPRATSVQTEEGSVTLGQAQGFVKPTGLPEVDAVLVRYGMRTQVIA